MRIDYLKYLKAIEKYRSITVAAQNVYLGQSTLNTILRNIENEIGISIFHRGSKGFTPTIYGKIVLEMTDNILRNYENICNLKDMEENECVSIPILVLPSIITSLAIPLCDAFQRKQPDATLEFRELSYTNLISALHDNEAKIGLTYVDNTEELQQKSIRYQFQVKPLLRDNPCLMVRKDHPYAGMPDVSCIEMNGQSVAYLSYMENCDAFSSLIKSLVSKNTLQDYPKMSQIIRTVQTENKVAFVNGYAAANIIKKFENSIRMVPISDLNNRSRKYLCLIHKVKTELNASEIALIQCICEYFKDYLADADNQDC